MAFAYKIQNVPKISDLLHCVFQKELPVFLWARVTPFSLMKTPSVKFETFNLENTTL